MWYWLRSLAPRVCWMNRGPLWTGGALVAGGETQGTGTSLLWDCGCGFKLWDCELLLWVVGCG